MRNSDGTIKCIEDEIPFEIPKSWEWVRFLTGVTLVSGQDLEPREYNTLGKGIPYITGASNIENENIIINRWTDNGRVFAYKDDLLLTCKGTIGTIAVLNESKVHIARQIMAVRSVGNIEILYIKLVLTALVATLKIMSKGLIPGITRNDVLYSLLPVPPLGEQQRIISYFHKTNLLVTTIENGRGYFLNTISKTKSKILDLAIRGKLVPQDESDEPASMLLERIRAEKEELIKQGKIKRDKRESVIYRDADNSYYERFADGSEKCIDEEIPFKIPDSWLFVRLKEIGSIIGGGTPRTSNESYWDGNIDWITPADLSNHGDIYISHGSRSITELGLKGSSATLMPAHTVLYSSRAPVGHIAIAANALATNQGFKSVVPYDTRMSLFVYFCLKERTPSIVLRATGTTFKEISGTAMAETIVPLPPLREQKQICNKIRSLFTVLENMHQIID